MSTIPLTKRGAEMLKDELHRLKHVERPAVVNAIAEARAQGDLSENAEYDAAKDKQGFIEGRIMEIEGKLAAAQIIDPSSLDAGGRVVFGATVELEDEDSGEAVTYQIVGEDEADIKQGLLSINSPIARASLARKPVMWPPSRRRAAPGTTKSCRCATCDERHHASTWSSESLASVAGHPMGGRGGGRRRAGSAGLVLGVAPRHGRHRGRAHVPP